MCRTLHMVCMIGVEGESSNVEATSMLSLNWHRLMMPCGDSRNGNPDSETCNVPRRRNKCLLLYTPHMLCKSTAWEETPPPHVDAPMLGP